LFKKKGGHTPVRPPVFLYVVTWLIIKLHG
jgi:hypothetical protein